MADDILLAYAAANWSVSILLRLCFCSGFLFRTQSSNALRCQSFAKSA